MLEVGRRKRGQPAPRWVVFEALTDPNRDPTRQWLTLAEDEQAPSIVEAVEPELVVWSSLWPRRPDAQIRFECAPETEGSGTDLTWTLLVDEPGPDPSLLGHMRKRINVLINGELRFSLGQ